MVMHRKASSWPHTLPYFYVLPSTHKDAMDKWDDAFGTISWSAYNPIQKRFLAVRTINVFIALTASLTCQALQALANVIVFMYNQFRFLIYFLQDICSMAGIAIEAFMLHFHGTGHLNGRLATGYT